MQALISIKKISKKYTLSRQQDVHALKDFSVDILSGETLGLVGESGSGKTTVGRIIVGLLEPDYGTVYFEDIDVHKATKAEKQYISQNIQMVFQDPYSSLNPRMLVKDIISEPLSIHKICKNKNELQDRVYELLNEVGLSESMANRYPSEFSGGQRQRIGIARALALSPKFIVCDEAVSALDVSVQAQIITLLKRLQKEKGLTYLFISHDLSVVREISNRVGVLYHGELLELEQSTTLYKNPKHKYTQELLSAVLPVDTELARAKLKWGIA